MLQNVLEVCYSILERHSLDNAAMQQFTDQLLQVLQQDCCDYFTALPLVKGLTDSLHEVLDLQLPLQLIPVVRRSYVSAMWLLQRSKFYKWNTKYMSRALAQGLYRLYEAHADSSAGRPISYHHISKSGGTSLCQLAGANRCKGPIMTKSVNCLLDTGMDGPVWALKHDSLKVNNIPDPPDPQPPPPPPPPPPRPPRPPRPPKVPRGQRLRPEVKQGADFDPMDLYLDDAPDDDFDDDDDDRFEAAAAAVDADLDVDADGNPFPNPAPRPLAPLSQFEWFMYACPKLVRDKQEYGCDTRQETAAAKAATFFANEHTLSVVHSTPQEALATRHCTALLELTVEASQAADLSWWQQWAPAVVSSYSARTLLGPRAFCPPEEPQQAVVASLLRTAPVAPVVQGKAGDNRQVPGQAGPPGLPLLSEAEVHTALAALYSFDVVLDLTTPGLMDVSLVKLLGWTHKHFSSSQAHRSTTPAKVLSWEELWLFARQQAVPSPPPPAWPPPQPPHSSKPAAATKRALRQHGQQAELEDSRAALTPDVAARMIAEVRYRQLLEATAADRQLHQHAQLLQVLDAAWLTALGEQRSYIRKLRELVADIERCGFAGLQHEQ
eukprot:gene2572-2874_t